MSYRSRVTSHKCILEVMSFIWPTFIKHALCSWRWTRPWSTHATRSLPLWHSHNNLCFFSKCHLFHENFPRVPRQWAEFSHLWSLSISLYLLYSTSVYFCSLFSPIFYQRGPMPENPTYACPYHPCEGSMARWHRTAGTFLVPGDRCWLEGAMLSPLWARSHAWCGFSFNPLGGKNVGAEEKTQVQGNLIWLVQVHKEFIVEVNLQQGLEEDSFG